MHLQEKPQEMSLNLRPVHMHRSVHMHTCISGAVVGMQPLPGLSSDTPFTCLCRQSGSQLARGEWEQFLERHAGAGWETCRTCPTAQPPVSLLPSTAAWCVYGADGGWCA